MKAKLVRTQVFKAVLGTALVTICGLVLWKTPLGDAWVNASYDYLFRFDASQPTNKVVFVVMDNEAYDALQQSRGEPWDRALHARLLNKLADDGCPLVVLDAWFRKPQDATTDQLLAAAMRRQRHIVLLADLAKVEHPEVEGAHPTLPTEPFLSAAGEQWGVGWVDGAADTDSVVRRHWPDPSPGPFPSLPWTAAKLAGAPLTREPQERWLRFYDKEAWKTLSYSVALDQATNYFRNQIVFIGMKPASSLMDGEKEEFRIPATRWTNESVSGAEIMMTSFLNLMNGDWLRRPILGIELLGLVLVGVLLGGASSKLRPVSAVACAVLFCMFVSLAAILTAHFTHYWFPWLIVVGGQVPVAVGWTLASRMFVPVEVVTGKELVTVPQPILAAARQAPEPDALPETPDYDLVNPPFGRGAYGRVWLVRNAVGQWQALKTVYLANFNDDPDPYDREFNGISRYKPVSDQHPGLLRVDFVSRKRSNYFYYVMELGDPLDPGWEKEPSSYKPRDLISERARSKGRRLPVEECIRIGLGLSDALDFLHRQGLTHRDIKPQNIIYVNGRPKLADVGLIGRIRPPGEQATAVGTPGYMPPAPELPGTPQADIYALGMVLYVLSTGNNPAYFPELSTTLVKSAAEAAYFPLNDIILKACQPDCAKRYTSAGEMYRALSHVQRVLNGDTTTHEVLNGVNF